MVQPALATAWGNVSSIAADAAKVAAALADMCAKVAGNVAVDIAGSPDTIDVAGSAKMPDAANAIDPDPANVEPHDKLQSAIDRLRECWGPASPGPAT